MNLFHFDVARVPWHKIEITEFCDFDFAIAITEFCDSLNSLLGSLLPHPIFELLDCRLAWGHCIPLKHIFCHRASLGPFFVIFRRFCQEPLHVTPRPFGGCVHCAWLRAGTGNEDRRIGGPQISKLGASKNDGYGASQMAKDTFFCNIIICGVVFEANDKLAFPINASCPVQHTRPPILFKLLFHGPRHVLFVTTSFYVNIPQRPTFFSPSWFFLFDELKQFLGELNSKRAAPGPIVSPTS